MKRFVNKLNRSSLGIYSRFMSPGAVGGCVLLLGVLFVGDGDLPDSLSLARVAQADSNPDLRPSSAWPNRPSKGDIEAGKKIYFKRCVFCHGKTGAGDGPEAHTHWPRPRNFLSGTFKVRHTESGGLPTERDLFLTITHGLPGSAMPSWERLLTERERHQVAFYIMTHLVQDRDYRDEESEEYNLIDYGQQIPTSKESIKRGEKVFYKIGKCEGCHGEKGRGDGNLTMKDEWGLSIVPADLYRCWNFRGNRRDPYNPRNIFREVSTGLSGTPMPSYVEILSPKQRWDVANFVISLCPKQKISPKTGEPVYRSAIRSNPIMGFIPSDPDHPVWGSMKTRYIQLPRPIVEKPGPFVQLLDSLWVKSIYNDKEIAWYLEWHDRTKSMAKEKAKDLLVGDAVVNDLLGMAFWNPKRKTLDVWEWEADGIMKEYTGRAAIGKPMTLSPRSRKNVKVVYSKYDAGRWRVILVRELKKRRKKHEVRFKINEPILTDFYALDGHNGTPAPNFPKWEGRYKTVLMSKDRK